MWTGVEVESLVELLDDDAPGLNDVEVWSPWNEANINNDTSYYDLIH